MHWFESDHFERVALTDLNPGDLVHLANAFWDGEPIWWQIEPHKITGVEERAKGVWFLLLAPESIKPGHMPFTMLCGPHIAAGVIRLRPVKPPLSRSTQCP